MPWRAVKSVAIVRLEGSVEREVLGFGGDDCAVKDGIERWCGVEEGGRWSVVLWRPHVTTYVCGW
jgi:hypothetical protein